MPLNLNLDSTGVVRIVCTAGRLCRLPGLCMPLLLAACSFPTLPDSRPTVQEVPFLGQQMTQEQISTRRAEVVASRATLRQELAQDKAACYARHAVLEYWVADLQRGALVQMWEPAGEGFASRTDVAFGAQITSATIEGLRVPLPQR